MAYVIRQAWHHARKPCHCYLCGHPIRQHDEYQSLTFRPDYSDRWTGLRFVKACKWCFSYTLHPNSECDYVIAAGPAEPIGDWLAQPSHGGRMTTSTTKGA